MADTDATITILGNTIYLSFTGPAVVVPTGAMFLEDGVTPMLLEDGTPMNLEG